MSDKKRYPSERLSDSEAEIRRLNKVIRALVNRVERSSEVEGSDFTLFQTALMLDDRVRQQTAELQAVVQQKERISLALSERELLYRSVVSAMVEGVVLQLSDGTISQLNPAAERMLGISSESSVGYDWEALPCRFLHADGRPMDPQELPSQRVLSLGAVQSAEAIGLCSAGEADDVIWVAVTAHLLKTSGSQALEKDRVVTFMHDITAIRNREEALRKSEEKFAAIFNMTPDPFALTRLRDGVIVEVSRSFCEFFGLQESEAIGHSTLPGDLNIWVNAEDRRHWANLLLQRGEVIGLEVRLHDRYGRTRTVLISGKVIEMRGEQYVVTDIHDISVQKQAMAYYERIANHDPLTGLPNRLLLADRLRQAIARSQRDGTQVAVCYLDLDGFKAVNDSLGHDVGDCLLLEVSQRLTDNIRDVDTLARLGGDEFVVLFCDLDRDSEYLDMVNRLLEIVARPFRLEGGREVRVSLSIGVTLCPQDGIDPDRLIQHADKAMYAAKRKGRNRYCLSEAIEGMVAKHQ